MRYIRVAIKNNNDQLDVLYVYKTDDDAVRVGDRVHVPFNQEPHPKPGFVFEVLDEIPEDAKQYRIRGIKEIDHEHSTPSHAIPIATWMRNRYFCRAYDAAALFSSPVKKTAKRKSKVDGVEGLDEIELENPLPTLSEEQMSAMSTIEARMDTGKYRTYLIHGVTGSGKTEVYMRTAMKARALGKKTIVLVPEISLTPQTIRRFVARFGRDAIAIMHSKLSAGERYEEWQRIRQGKADIVIGARSAIYAPFEEIGAIIIDEEHESSYKSDTVPVYSAVEVAIKIGIESGAVVLLGSATPSIVSMYRAKIGLYHIIHLKERYNQRDMPPIEVIDMREELRFGNRSIFSSALYDQMQTSLDNGHQSIIFLNRRGYSTFITCRSCGYLVRCPNCGISMTYHKDEGVAVCHFCGEVTPAPTRCPKCDSPYLRYYGIGTEQVEEITRETFPDVGIARMDADTTTGKGSVSKILSTFAKLKTKILIGTQMIAKGLDFAHVTVVGIISADVSLNVPDFRAAERTFQLITQVAGRAGRAEHEGRVVVQTYQSEHYSIQDATTYDYDRFFDHELNIRKLFLYPPFSDIYVLTITDPSEEKAIRTSEQIVAELLRRIGESERACILGPTPDRIKYFEENFRYRINIKVMPDRRLTYEKELAEIRHKINVIENAGTFLSIDVNPTFVT
ncbi:MAG: primosomal protein N' [Clostridiales Family XIII bacterium]|nr:primosomal protein N' [Clostridiales Family XIII bacterium]